jgi:glucose-1-phosphate thymidylyltransferase
MIYGLIPIGGKGLRLGLPYSKEMLPQKNFTYYNPIVNHTVAKMLSARVDHIVFVHGKKFKKDVKKFYQDDNYIHLKQTNEQFGGVLYDFYNSLSIDDHDQIVFGLPDTIYQGNPFKELLTHPNIVAGLFQASDYSLVDRLWHGKFQVKSPKTNENEVWFWGTLKFDGADIKKMIDDKQFNKHTEIGSILNEYDFRCAYFNKYFDLGTWKGYNDYLNSDL